MTKIINTPHALDKAPINVSQTMLQQRHILAMMGVDVWLKRDSRTLNVDMVDMHEIVLNFQDVSQNISQDISQVVANTAKGSTLKDNSTHIKTTHINTTHIKTAQPKSIQQESSDKKANNQEVNNRKEKNQPQDKLTSIAHHEDVKTVVKSETNDIAKVDVNKGNDDVYFTEHDSVLKQTSSQDRSLKDRPLKDRPLTDTSLQKVPAFQLIGACYNGWVLLIDAQYLKDTQLALLWANILKALSVTAEYLNFPICEEINDKESADASVAGFVFRLAKTDKVKLVALTLMPESIDDKRLFRVHYLEEMLHDGSQKKRLWQLLTERQVVSKSL